MTDSRLVTAVIQPTRRTLISGSVVRSMDVKGSALLTVDRWPEDRREGDPREASRQARASRGSPFVKPKGR
jgi:hypothetical protein